MEQVNIKRWIDFDGEEFKRLDNVGKVRSLILKSVSYDLYLFDKDGRVFFQGKPIYAELDGEYVGIRYPMKACS